MRSTPSPLILPQKNTVYQSRGASGRFRRNPLQLRSSSLRPWRVRLCQRPPRPVAGFGGIFPGGGTGDWDRSQLIPSSPPNHGSAAKPERRTLADYGVTSGGRVRRPTVRPVAGDGRPEQAKRRKPCPQREVPLRAVNPIPRSQLMVALGRTAVVHDAARRPHPLLRGPASETFTNHDVHRRDLQCPVHVDSSRIAPCPVCANSGHSPRRREQLKADPELALGPETAWVKIPSGPRGRNVVAR
jgi:hypothetical protein